MPSADLIWKEQALRELKVALGLTTSIYCNELFLGTIKASRLDPRTD